MRVVIAIPYRDIGCRWRRRAMRVVTEHLSPLPWRIEMVDDGTEPFARGSSLNRAFTLHDADVIVACDADLIVSLEALSTAVELSTEEPGMVVPFTSVQYMGASGSEHYTFEVAPDTPLLGGCNVISRDTWNLSGGWLEGFRGWGCEDIAMATQCAVLAGPLRRVDGRATHLYHPKSGAYVDDDIVARNGALMRHINELAARPDELREFVKGPPWTR